jgi:tRNA (mo5U34)-methyltransferase
VSGHAVSESPRGDAEAAPSLEERVAALSPWFQNLRLDGVETAPRHFLGDYPRVKWEKFRDAIPADLSGKTVLDVGCNAGFYSIEMKRRGAERVVGIDTDERYLAQARLASEVCGADLELHRLSVYEVGALRERFDLVLFMGVLYHLRHPLLALDLLAAHAVRDTLVFQSMQRGSARVLPIENDYPFSETEVFRRTGYPVLHFVEKRYTGDATNWWIPNRACSEAMLRSAGFRIVAHPEDEVYVCRVDPGEARRAGEAPPELGGAPP